MNPCPCGYYGTRRCECSSEQVNRYQRRVSGPLLDRIDMQVQVNPPDNSALLRAGRAKVGRTEAGRTEAERTEAEQIKAGQTNTEENSALVKQRVIAARKLQIERQGKINAKLNIEELSRFAPLSKESETLLKHAMEKLDLSARGLHKVLRVARTIADLERSDFGPAQIKQALSFREQKMLK
ncbi:MAG: ATP-binding protein [Porticoccaceae bacterium]|nr:ATP-binding protein [Porticoccaceae bacterium]